MTRRDWLLASVSPLALPVVFRMQRGPAVDLTALPVAELAARYRAGTLSPRDVTESYLARIAALDGDLHAYVTVTTDVARAQARALSAIETRKRGPLYGIPVAHKDLFETSGIRTTGGSRLYEDHVPTEDATVVARLSAAGAITLGKTNTHELGGGVTTVNPFYGTTTNPRDRTRIPGGSSGGSAAAVAAHVALAATGSDTGGSVRIPAALCGCVGFKPTFGLLSTAGVLGASPTFDHAGFLTRTVADLTPLLEATMGVDALDVSTVPPISLNDGGVASLSGLRVGVARTYFFDNLDSEVARAIERVLAGIAKAGAHVRDVRTPVDSTTMARVFDPIVVAEIHQTYERDWRERPQAFSSAFAEVFKAPLPTALDLVAAHRQRRGFQVEMTRVFDEVDVLVMPTVPTVAPPVAGPIDGNLLLRNTVLFNAARTPALSLPCGPPDRLPVGLQLVARPFGDARLLQIAALVERQIG
jgi:aspartyl-tRNA(Asn)/glutamyl-tRNA(Gln) amidotransferase subunit A